MRAEWFIVFGDELQKVTTFLAIEREFAFRVGRLQSFVVEANSCISSNFEADVFCIGLSMRHSPEHDACNNELEFARPVRARRLG